MRRGTDQHQRRLEPVIEQEINTKDLRKKMKDRLRVYKLYIFVRNDLGMNKGKIAAQVGHACWRLGSSVAMDYWTQTESYSEGEERHAIVMANIEYDYMEAGEKKLIFKVKEFPFKLFKVDMHQEDTFYKNDQYFTLVKDTNIEEFTVFAALVHEHVDTRWLKLL